MPRPSNRIARLKASAAARKDPFNRAARAPLVRQPSTCPVGKCEHSDLLHGRSLGEAQAEVVSCSECECEGTL
jgi:hypothetical protein